MNGMAAGVRSGTPGSPGSAAGPVWTLPASVLTPEQRSDATLDEAIAALATAAAQLHEAAAARHASGAAEEGDIFSMQATMASDPAFVAAIREASEGGADGVAALIAAGEAQASLLASLPDEYLSARAADVRDVALRAARILAGTSIPLPGRPVILVAEDFPPSVSAEIPREHLLGIALRAGSRTAHAVILARAAGIPSIVAARALEVDGSLDGVQAVLDGTAGTLTLAPSSADIATAEATKRQSAADAARRAALRGTPCLLANGRRVHLYANIGSAEGAARAVEVGAEGVGLLRSEFLLLDRETPPDEREQLRAFTRVFETLGSGRPLTLRLADIGGDKEIPYLKLPHEANPFLGVRGYRLAMIADRPDLRALFASQVAAALRAAAATGGSLRIMAPMISVRAEVDDLLALISSVRAELSARGEAAAATYPAAIGIMIEVPAAALTVADVAAGLDFVSVGTNDLTQYAMAADRINPALVALQDAAAPGVVALLRAVVQGAKTAGVEVGVCGELAGSVSGAKLLTEIGVFELSMDPAAVDEVREGLLGA
ncbi:MAG: phosphoenolpyruvate--protein phosphotransferase [Candidatus Limnocylindrus sp.]